MIPHHDQRETSTVGDAKEVVCGKAERIHERHGIVPICDAVVLAQVNPTVGQLVHAPSRIGPNRETCVLHQLSFIELWCQFDSPRTSTSENRVVEELVDGEKAALQRR